MIAKLNFACQPYLRWTPVGAQIQHQRSVEVESIMDNWPPLRHTQSFNFNLRNPSRSGLYETQCHFQVHAPQIQPKVDQNQRAVRSKSETRMRQREQISNPNLLQPCSFMYQNVDGTLARDLPCTRQQGARSIQCR